MSIYLYTYLSNPIYLYIYIYILSYLPPMLISHHEKNHIPFKLLVSLVNLKAPCTPCRSFSRVPPAPSSPLSHVASRTPGYRHGKPMEKRTHLGRVNTGNWNLMGKICSNHWIGLRENLQETMVFTIKYRAFL